MNAQEILTLGIEGMFWVTVAFMLSQFITGLFVFSYHRIVSLNSNAVVVSSKPLHMPALTTQCFEELPDPWTLPIEKLDRISNFTNQTVLPFPTLKLLPAALEIQPQPKRTTRSKKTSQPKSPNKSKTNKSTTSRQPRKSRKQVA